MSAMGRDWSFREGKLDDQTTPQDRREDTATPIEYRKLKDMNVANTEALPRGWRSIKVLDFPATQIHCTSAMQRAITCLS